jgi:hypothetical protein
MRLAAPGARRSDAAAPAPGRRGRSLLARARSGGVGRRRALVRFADIDAPRAPSARPSHVAVAGATFMAAGGSAPELSTTVVGCASARARPRERASEGHARGWCAVLLARV